MKRAWIGLGLLSGSWLLGLSYFQPAGFTAWTLVVLAGTIFLAAAPRGDALRFRDALVSMILLLPAVWFLPWPFRAGPLLLALGLALQLLPVPRLWPKQMGWGAIAAGVVLLAQSGAFRLYADSTARSHDLPQPLVHAVAAVARLLGLETAVEGKIVALYSVRQVHRLAATWELLVDPTTLLFLVGGPVLLGMIAWHAGAGGKRWAAWLGAFRTFTLVVLAWLPVRLGLVISLYLHRSLRSPVDQPLTTMNQFFSPWVHLMLVAFPVLAACWLIGPPTGGTETEPEGSGEPKSRAVRRREARRSGRRGEPAAVGNPSRNVVPPWLFPATLGLVSLGVAVAVFVNLWDPVGRRKGGRVMFVERHSTWEPTDRPYDTEHFGHDPSYSYTKIYDYASHYYDMSRLQESDPIDAAKLGECDVLVVKIPTARFLGHEVHAIHEFVEQGGGLLLVGDHTNVFDSSTYLNDICRPLGFTFRNDLLFRVGSPYEQLVPRSRLRHPAVEHVPTMHYAVSCSIDPGRSRGRAAVQSAGVWNLPPDYHADNYHPQAEYRPDMQYGAFIQLWATRHGRGRVLAFTDSTIFSNFCVFQPGKTELMMGMLEWLNRTSPFDRRGLRIAVVLMATLLGVGLLGVGCAAAWRGRVTWLAVFSAGMLGATVGAVAVAGVQRAAMTEPPQKPDRPMTRVVIDRTVSEVPLSLGAFTQGEGQGYGLLEQWIPRLGYFTMRRSGAEAFTGDALVIICPSGSVTDEYRQRLVQYVERGGRVLILDAPGNTGSTANSLLWPFEMLSDHSGGAEGVLELADGWPGIELTGSCRIAGGEPFLWVGDTPVGARVSHGKGSVMAIGIGSVFDDTVMGGEWTTEPDESMRTIFDLLFAVLRGAVEDQPVVSPPPEEAVGN